MTDARPTLAEPAATRWDGPPPSGTGGWAVGDLIDGTYEVRRVFAGGGMGLVYQVRHRGWGLDLAVKRPRPEFFATDAQRADFEREAETWAGLGLHPHVAACHYVRRIAGVPCVFAEFVPGGSLADRLRDGPLSPAAAIDAAVQAAWGLGHAHDRGLVHQDVKPANLLTAGDGGAVKVTDFGLAAARATTTSGAGGSAAGRTVAVAGAGLFTPEYAAPEQFAGAALTRRADVWALAVTLLELLTGRRPAVGPAAPELLAVVDRAGWPGGLHDLLRDALTENPDDRPRDMAAVVERLTASYRACTGTGYPRRPPRAARLDLDAKNNRAVSLADLGKPDAAEALWAEVLRLDRGHPEAAYNLGLARWRAGRLSLDWLLRDLREAAPGDPRPARLVGRLHLEAGDPVAAAEAVAGCDAADEVTSEAAARQAYAPTLAWRVTAHPDGVRALACGGGRVVTAGADRVVRVWDRDGRPVCDLAGHRSTPETVAVSADGRFVLSAAPQDDDAPAELRLWDADRKQGVWLVESVNTPDPTARSVVPMAAVAVGSTDAVSLSNGLLERRDHAGRVVAWARGVGFHAAAGGDVVVSQAGDGTGHTLHVWDRATLSSRRTVAVPGFVDELEVRADGAVATGRVDGRRRFWDLATGDELPPPCPWPHPTAARADGPLDGQRERVTLSVAATGAPLYVFTPHPGDLRPHVAVADGLLVTAAGYGDGAGELAAWRLAAAAAPYTAPPALCVAQPTERVVAAEADADAHLADALVARDRGDWSAAAGHLRAARAVPGAARRRDVFTAWAALAPHLARGDFRGGWEADTFETGAGGRGLALAPDGRRVVTPCAGGFRLHDADTAAPLADLPASVGDPRAVVFTADGVLTATGRIGAGGELAAWDADGRQRWAVTLPSPTAGFADVMLSGDGRLALTVHGDWTAALWDITTGRRVRDYSRRLGGLTAVAPGPAGDWFVAADDAGAVRVWDAATGRCRRTLDVGPRAAVTAVAVTPDGRSALVGCAGHARGTAPELTVARPMGDGGLAFAGVVRVRTPDDMLAAARDQTHDQTAVPPPALRLFDLTTGRVVRTFDAPAGVATVAVSPDGRLAVTGDEDRAVRVWDVATGACLRAFPGHREAVERVALCGDPSRAASADRAGWVKVWALDWEYADQPPADPPRPPPVAFGPDEFEPPRLRVHDDAPNETVVATTTVADHDDRPVVLAPAKLVWAADGLYRGDPDGPHELLHARGEIVGVGLEYPYRLLTPVWLVTGTALAAAAYLYAPADWGWKLALTLAALTPFGLVAWFAPVLVVRTRDGVSRYEVAETGPAPRDFVASVALTLDTPEAAR